MKLITNIEPPSLPKILLRTAEKLEEIKLEEIKAAVAYCENYKLFEHCKKNKIRLCYYARLDSTINLDLKKLKSFLTDDISIYIIGGSKFHPKVIWSKNYGVYIGSANLTQSAWKSNIECGLWLTQKELDTNGLIDSLNSFFKFIEEEATPLSNISDCKIQKLNKNKQNSKIDMDNSSKFKELEISVFKGFSNRKDERKNNQQISNKGEYKEGSGWNNVNEMRCLLIFKRLEEEGFPSPRGLQTKLCKKMANIPNIGLTEKSIQAKVGNYKSVANVNNPSNASQNTKRIYEENHNLSIKELGAKIQDQIQKKPINSNGKFI